MKPIPARPGFVAMLHPPAGYCPETLPNFRQAPPLGPPPAVRAAERSARATLLGLFRRQVERAPSAPALIEPGGSADWTEMAEKALAYRRLFSARWPGEGRTVALSLGPSPDATAAILAALEEGARYVFVPPGLARGRLADLLAQCSVDLLVDGPGSIVPLSASEGSSARWWSPAADVVSAVFTSGSAGRPKAFLLSAESLLNRLEWMWESYPFGPGEICLHYKHPSVVGSIWEIFGGLLAGAPTYVAPADEVRDPVRFFEAVRRQGVTRASLTPPLAGALIAEKLRTGGRDRLRLVCCSAEPMRGELPARWRSAFPDARLLNLYGSTECSSNALAFDATDWEGGDPVPVGRTISRVEAWVIGADGAPVADGSEGELHIGGACLAAGQLGGQAVPRLTRHRIGNGERWLLPTGDRARQGQNGVELLGRLDGQIKVRGLCIDFSEVELALESDPQVHRAVALPLERAGSTVLVAAVTGDAPLRLRELREHFLERLPASHFPARIEQVPEFPLTASGKVDRAALAARSDRQSAIVAAPPLGGLNGLVGILGETLLVDNFDEDRPLLDQGSDSLLLLDALVRINAEYGVAVTVAEMFDAATPAALFALIGDKQARPRVQ